MPFYQVAAMPIESSAALVDVLRSSRLLSPRLGAELIALTAYFPEARALARELLRRGWLTAYQINRVFAGKAAELILGQYVLLERLGEGVAGQVFKARHLRLG